MLNGSKKYIEAYWKYSFIAELEKKHQKKYYEFHQNLFSQCFNTPTIHIKNTCYIFAQGKVLSKREKVAPYQELDVGLNLPANYCFGEQEWITTLNHTDQQSLKMIICIFILLILTTGKLL